MDPRIRGDDSTEKFGFGATGRYSLKWAFTPAVIAGLLLLAASLTPLSGFAAAPSKATLEHLGNQVYCQCGCATTLNHCPHLPSQCASRAGMTAAILTGISKGESGPAILQDLTRQYGVRVLASPPAAGFDLTVWVLPGIGLIIGLVIVVIIVRRWRRKPPPSGAASAEAPAPDAAILAAVEEEMNKF